jgi:hypothetical protein
LGDRGDDVGKRLLFSEEKRSKKDFPCLMRIGPLQTGESFLVLFFKKEPLSSSRRMPMIA